MLIRFDGPQGLNEFPFTRFSKAWTPGQAEDVSDQARLQLLLGSGRGWSRVASRAPGRVIQVTASRDARGGADGDDGATLVFMGAFTVTMRDGMDPGFGFACEPPASGNASIAFSGTTSQAGNSTTITRAAAGGAFAVVNIGSNQYRVTGS